MIMKLIGYTHVSRLVRFALVISRPNGHETSSWNGCMFKERHSTSFLMPPFDDYTNQIPFGVAWLKARHLLTSVLQSDIGNFFF